MKDKTKERIEKLGLSVSDFQTNSEKLSADDRLTILEDAFAELCEEVLSDD